MGLSEEILQFLREYGPVAASIVGTVLSTLIGLILWLGVRTWGIYEEKLKQTASLVDRLAEALAKQKDIVDSAISRHRELVEERVASVKILIEENHKLSSEEHKENWEYVQQLRTELVIHVRSMETTTRSVNSLDGVVRSQQSTLIELVRETTKLNGKIEAIFRVIDAPHRGTDSR